MDSIALWYVCLPLLCQLTCQLNWGCLGYVAAVNDSALAAEELVRFDCNMKSRTNVTNETALEMAERLRSHLVAILLYEVMYNKPKTL